VTLSCVGGLCVSSAGDANTDELLDADVDADVPFDAMPDSPPDASPDAACEAVSATPPAGHHNPGMGCRSSAACHNAQLGLGAGAPEYSAAGTFYKDTAGTMPYPGASVTITVNGVTKKTVAADNGNFWFVPALLPAPTNAETGNVFASACPNTAVMAGAIVSGGGDCDNCHRAAGGTTLPIYVLPQVRRFRLRSNSCSDGSGRTGTCLDSPRRTHVKLI